MSLLNFFRRTPSTPKHSDPDLHREQLLASLLVMAWVVEARDPYTGGHLWRVSRFSRLLAERAGLPPATVARIALGGSVARIALGGFLHDLGKVGIPDAILGKRDRLTDEEYAVIKTHPQVGERMLAGHPFSPLVMDAVLLHHETPDGRGYPFGKRGEEIPEVARVVGIADAFDAMTSSRPYRAGMPVAKALSIIGENLGRQFDLRWGELFLTLGESEELHHIVGHSDEGIPLESCLMCGPIIVRPRHAAAGEHLYCPSCTGEYRVGEHGIEPTGTEGSPAAMQTRPDAELIARIARDSLPALESFAA